MFNPILGILASSGAVAGGSYESIATVSVGSGGSSSIDFTLIPSTYKHLQIRLIARDGAGTAYSYLKIKFNSDSGSNYRDHYIFGNGSTSGSGTNSLTFIENDGIPGGTAGASMFGGGIIDILDYTSTSKNKTLRSLVGSDRNGGGEIYFNSGLYFATPSAITSITLLPNSGNFAQYSHFALYGVKD